MGAAEHVITPPFWEAGRRDVGIGAGCSSACRCRWTGRCTSRGPRRTRTRSWRGRGCRPKPSSIAPRSARPAARERRYPWGDSLGPSARQFRLPALGPGAGGRASRRAPAPSASTTSSATAGNGRRRCSRRSTASSRWPSYPEYSADFFDGDHFVMKGASPVTARALVRPGFRNWFRPRYPYVYATFRTAGAQRDRRDDASSRPPLATRVTRLPPRCASTSQRTPRQLPSKYFYDELGSSLFEAICRLPWYRITRAESALLATPRARDPRAAPPADQRRGARVRQRREARDPRRRMPPSRIPLIQLVDISAAALDMARYRLQAIGYRDLLAHQRHLRGRAGAGGGQQAAGGRAARAVSRVEHRQLRSARRARAAAPDPRARCGRRRAAARQRPREAGAASCCSPTTTRCR